MNNEKVLKGACIIGQSGGPTAVINASAYGAIRAGLDCAWFILNNGAKVKIGIGRSRREAGERANIAEGIKGFGALSLVVFDLANGLYAYNIHSDFTRTFCDILSNKKGKMLTAFLLMFVLSYLLAIMGMGLYGLLLLIIIVAYYTLK